MSGAIDTHVQAAYVEATRLDVKHIPYQFGGDTLTGLDCSKAASWVLRDAKLIDRLMGTHELADVMAAGIGAHMTLWVANTALLEHALLEFDMPGHGRQWWAGRKTGTAIGFFDLAGGRDYLAAAGFRPRRRP